MRCAVHVRGAAVGSGGLWFTGEFLSVLTIRLLNEIPYVACFTQSLVYPDRLVFISVIFTVLLVAACYVLYPVSSPCSTVRACPSTSIMLITHYQVRPLPLRFQR